MEKKFFLGKSCVITKGLDIKPDSTVVTQEKIAGFKPGSVLEASELSGFPDLIFKKNESGGIEVFNNYK